MNPAFDLTMWLCRNLPRFATNDNSIKSPRLCSETRFTLCHREWMKYHAAEYNDYLDERGL